MITVILGVVVLDSKKCHNFLNYLHNALFVNAFFVATLKNISLSFTDYSENFPI